MKLAQYMENLKYLTLYTREEGKIEAAVTNDNNKAEDYASIIKILHEAIQRNREALGLNLKDSKDLSKMKEREIKGVDMERHIALVRHDVMQAVSKDEKLKAYKELAEEVLSELTLRTGTKDIGKTGSKEEKRIVAQARKPKESPNEARAGEKTESVFPSDKKPYFNKPYSELTDEEKKLYEIHQKAIEARLRAAGKIL